MNDYTSVLKINVLEEEQRNQGKASHKIPFPHQEECHKAMKKFYETKGSRGLLVLPTGGGKTFTAVLYLIQNVISQKKKILWLADQGFLLEQAMESFKENILSLDSKQRKNIDIRLVSGNSNHANTNSIKTTDDILLITSQTAISNWNCKDKNDDGEYVISKFQSFIDEAAKKDELFIVYDEAHHTPAFGRRNLLIGDDENNLGIHTKYPKVCLLGLTATPTYTDVKKRGWLWEIFPGSQPIYEVTKKRLQDEEILAQENHIPVKTNFTFEMSDSDLENLVIKHQEIPNRIIKEIADKDERNKFIAQYYWENKANLGKTIIFIDRWYQCQQIEKYINNLAGETVALSVFSFIDGNRNIDYINSRTENQNQENLSKFKDKNSSVKVLLNVKMLTEGVDVPDVESVFITRETNSKILFTQMIGRALRGKKAGGGDKKTKANIVFFIDNWTQQISFAGSGVLGGKENNLSNERGYRPFESISIDLINNLNLNLSIQNFESSLFDYVPIGWFVVNYSDEISEENENGETEYYKDEFHENVLVSIDEKELIDELVLNEKEINSYSNWGKENFDFEWAKNEVNDFLYKENFNHTFKDATIFKIIQIKRHLAQSKNIEIPEYFHFEEREVLNLALLVKEMQEKQYNGSQDEIDEQKSLFLNMHYEAEKNRLLKMVYSDFFKFEKAYDYELKVYKNKKKPANQIKGETPEVKTNRLLDNEQITKEVLQRDGYQCLCCGGKSKLNKDHLHSFKHNEPTNDNPILYQTLCKKCNNLKAANEFDFGKTNFKELKLDSDLNRVKSAIENNKLTAKQIEGEAKFIFPRIVNVFYATKAVQMSTVEVKNHGKAIWKLKLYSGINPEYILNHKDEILELLLKKGFRLSDFKIEEG